jgi:hypothetical protein
MTLRKEKENRQEAKVGNDIDYYVGNYVIQHWAFYSEYQLVVVLR